MKSEPGSSPPLLTRGATHCNGAPVSVCVCVCVTNPIAHLDSERCLLSAQSLCHVPRSACSCSALQVQRCLLDTHVVLARQEAPCESLHSGGCLVHVVCALLVQDSHASSLEEYLHTQIIPQ